MSFLAAVTAGRWERRRTIHLCRAFMDEWMGGLAPDDGWSEAQLAAVEGDLGVRVPPLLREFHGLLGKRQDALRLQDPMLRPDEWHLDGRDILVIREENQGCARWGVPLAESPDATVRWQAPPHGSAARWRDYGQHLSAFLLGALIGESMFSESVHTVYAYLDPAGYAAVPDAFRALAIPPPVYWPEPDGPRMGWYGDVDVLVRQEGNNSVWAMGRTAQVHDLMASRIPGDWQWLDK